jgi:hypothetical protein
MVPYSDHKRGIRVQFQYLCLDHACEVATWRLVHSSTSVIPEVQNV